MATVNNANIGFEKQIWDAACVLWGHIPAEELHQIDLQKVTLGSPARLQAPSQRLTVATNFLRVSPFREITVFTSFRVSIPSLFCSFRSFRSSFQKRKNH